MCVAVERATDLAVNEVTDGHPHLHAGPQDEVVVDVLEDGQGESGQRQGGGVAVHGQQAALVAGLVTFKVLDYFPQQQRLHHFDGLLRGGWEEETERGWEGHHIKHAFQEETAEKKRKSDGCFRMEHLDGGGDETAAFSSRCQGDKAQSKPRAQMAGDSHSSDSIRLTDISA